MSQSPLRQQLLRRRDVPDEDIDDIVELAQKRQDEALARREGRASVDEVKAVAAELDIAPEHVEAAIHDLRRQREQAAVAEAEAERLEELQRTRRGLMMRKLAKVGGAVMLALSMLTGGLAMSGRSTMLQAQRAVAEAQVDVDTALTRQASLAPQLVALAGAQGEDLSALQAAVRDAPDLASQLAAADALTTAMASKLGSLPPAASDAEATARLNLQDELTGSQNRVAVELRRYNDAEAQWQLAADGLTGGLAVGLGLVDGP